MSLLNKELFSSTLTDAESPFVITKDDGITQYSIKLLAGSATITGSRKLNGISSSAVPMDVNEPINGSVSEGVAVTITIAPGGSVAILAQ